MRRLLTAAVLSLFVAANAAAVNAAQYVVSQDGTGFSRTIRAAVDAAVYGDTVFIRPGVYEERVALKDGVRVLGSGADVTTIRYAYGFDEVVVARGMSSGSLEGVTIERLSSILPGPAILVDGAGAAFVSCRVTGGQGSGVAVNGTTARLSLSDTRITGNAGSGIRATEGAAVWIERCVIEGNALGGISAEGTSDVHLHATDVRDNGRSGLLVTDSASLWMDGGSVSGHDEWAIDAQDDAVVDIESTALTNNARGGVRLAARAEAMLASIDIHGGENGLRAADFASASVHDSSLLDVVRAAIVVGGAAEVSLDRVTIASAGGDGVAVADSARMAMVRSTVIRCGEDAVRCDAGALLVTDSILAYNGGAGLRVGASARDVTLARNNLWANGVDYVGVEPRSSDTMAPPEFVDAERGDFALRPDSPCLEAGSGWTALGAHGAATSALGLHVIPSITDPWLGAVWRAALRVDLDAAHLQELAFGLRWGERWLHVEADSVVLGSWGARSRVRIEGASGSLDPRTTGLSFAAGAEAVFDGVASRRAVWIGFGAVNSQFSADGRFSSSWPGPWSLSLSATWSGAIRLSSSVQLTDAALRGLRFVASTETPAVGGRLGFAIRGELLPSRLLAATAEWLAGAVGGSAEAEFDLSRAGTWRAALSFGDAAGEIGIRLRCVDHAPSSGGLSISLGASDRRATGELALSREEGVRLSLRLDIALDRWVRRAENLLPEPAFRIDPSDPEAGRPIRFTADESADPDGSIVDAFWDFGDGEIAAGMAVQHAYAQPGEYAVVLTVVDDRGAAVSSAIPVRIWPADTTPVAAFSAHPVSPSGIRLPRPLRDGDLVRLDASESFDRDGAIAEFAWDVGADGAVDAVGPDDVLIVGPLAAGSHPVTLRVTDDSGRSDAVMRVVWVDEAEPPRASFSFTPATPAVGDPVRFADQSADSDGSIADWEWTFGDGKTSRDASPVHRYERAGTFTARLRVRDDDGLTGDAERDVRVTTVAEITAVENVWALAIGISDYADVRDLAFASADAIALAEWLVGDAGVPPSHVRLLLDGQGPPASLAAVDTRTATLVNVREALGWLRRVALPNDLVLIHFSGHGFQGMDDDGDERDGLDEFFILHDTLDVAKEDTALRDDEFGRFLDRLASEHVIVFFDGCYSGGLSRSLPASARPATSGVDVLTDFSLEGRLVFSASGEGQEAFESAELRGGIFSHYILTGLRGEADLTGDGRVTAWELYEFVRPVVAARALAERGAVQEPQLLGEGEVRVLLAEAIRPPSADFAYAPTAPYAGGITRFVDQSSAQRGISTWEWDFGDGGTSAAPSPSHEYEDEGEVRVTLRVTDAAGATHSASQTMSIGPAGRVIDLDPDAGVVIISLGARHGVAIGDRFAVGASGEAELEVGELLEDGAAACRVVRGAMPTIGARLTPPRQR